jgi:hypothetical protein
MLEVSLIDHDLYIRVRQRHARLWDALLGRVANALAGISEWDWETVPSVSTEEVHQDLEFGRQ